MPSPPLLLAGPVNDPKTAGSGPWRAKTSYDSLTRVPRAESGDTYRNYTVSMLRRTGYRATWFPSESLELGGVGFLLSTGRFDQRARLRDFGVSFTSRRSGGSMSFDHQSSSGVSCSVKAAGQEKGPFQWVGTASAGIRFEFSRAGAIVFSAPDCVVTEIDNKRALERRLRDVQDWDNGWVVVTRVVRAKHATILVSGEKGAFTELRANAGLSLGGVDLAELAVGFQKARSSSMSVDLVARGDLTPLFEAHQLAHPSWRSRDPKKRRLLLV